MDNPVSMRRDGNVAIITIDNPPVNALRHGVRKGILDCVTAARDDASVEAIVLTGAGRTFVAGADITEFGKPSQPPGLIEVISRHRRHQEADRRGRPRHAARRRARTDHGLPFPRRGGGHAARPAGDQARPHPGRRRHAAPAAPRRHREGTADDPVGRSDPRQGRARGRSGGRDHRGRSGRRRGRVRPQGAGREASARAREGPRGEARRTSAPIRRSSTRSSRSTPRRRAACMRRLPPSRRSG